MTNSTAELWAGSKVIIIPWCLGYRNLIYFVFCLFILLVSINALLFHCMAHCPIHCLDHCLAKRENSFNLLICIFAHAVHKYCSNSCKRRNGFLLCSRQVLNFIYLFNTPKLCQASANHVYMYVSFLKRVKQQRLKKHFQK